MQDTKSIVEWENESDKLAKNMEEYAENYQCKKCLNNDRGKWCEHLLNARAKKFRKRIIEQLDELSRLE